MAFAQLTWRDSLRDVEASLSANSTKLYAMGLRSAVKRSTLADANESRNWLIWSDLAAVLIRRARKLCTSDSLGVELDNIVYALDSSTVDLCLSLFDWASFRSTKAAIKLHTLLDLRGAIPAFIHISDGKMGDVNVLDMLSFEAGAFYVMDWGVPGLHQAASAASGRRVLRHPRQAGMDARRVYSNSVDRSTGLVCDQLVMLTGYYPVRNCPEHLRRIEFKDSDSVQTLVFLTNNTALPALTICAFYKSRRQAELSFKWIKQHLRIKHFFGNSENAVKTKVWCTVATYVLIAIVRKELQIQASMYTCLQILSVSIFEKNQLSRAYPGGESTTEQSDDAKQLISFNR
jgi:Transposase DDE domain/Domain of unknown function (DUF4372)